MYASTIFAFACFIMAAVLLVNILSYPVIYIGYKLSNRKSGLVEVKGEAVTVLTDQQEEIVDAIASLFEGNAGVRKLNSK
jgi:hypothetical protein